MNIGSVANSTLAMLTAKSLQGPDGGGNKGCQIGFRGPAILRFDRRPRRDLAKSTFASFFL